MKNNNKLSTIIEKIIKEEEGVGDEYNKKRDENELNLILKDTKNNLFDFIRNHNLLGLGKVNHRRFEIKSDGDLCFIFHTNPTDIGYLEIYIYGGQPSSSLKNQLINNRIDFNNKIEDFFNTLTTIKNEEDLEINRKISALGDNDFDLLKSNISVRAKTALKRNMGKDKIYVSDMIRLFEKAKRDEKHGYGKHNPILRFRNLGVHTKNEIMELISPYL